MVYKPFYPEVQSVEIAIIYKGKAKHIEKIASSSLLTPKMKKEVPEPEKSHQPQRVKEIQLPTIKHGDKVLHGVTNCIEYIDETFGEEYKDFYPKETTSANMNLYCTFFVETSMA